MNTIYVQINNRKVYTNTLGALTYQTWFMPFTVNLGVN